MALTLDAATYKIPSVSVSVDAGLPLVACPEFSKGTPGTPEGVDGEEREW